jgi:hypothetical protein
VSPRNDDTSKNPSGDDLDDALLDCLAQIRRELQAASRGEELGDDGDGLVDAAASLDALVDRIVQDANTVEHADLDAIVAKACSTRPEDRYDSVAAFGADIEAFLAGREVSARRRGVIEKARRVAGRRWSKWPMPSSSIKSEEDGAEPERTVRRFCP